ncbi:MAG: hypothetical protein AAGC60_07255 [Acidobacteriota bacterium]
MRTVISLLVAGLVCTGTSHAQWGSSYGFDDPGFSQARIQTEYINEGTWANPLTVDPCVYPPASTINNPGPCSGADSVYGSGFQALGWAQNRSLSSAGQYWVLGMNVEFDAFENCNPGPPNMSAPRAEPGFGLMGFKAIKSTSVGEQFWRGHLVLNNTIDQNPCSAQSGAYIIPFLSLGAQQSRGNSRAVGALNATNGAPYKTRFTYKLWDYYPGAPAFSYVYAIASWGGESRLLFVRLFHEGPGGELPNGEFGGLWNWPARESFYAPGADLAYFDAERTAAYCGHPIRRSVPSDKSTNHAVNNFNYEIDWQTLFRCASNRGLFSDPMPQTWQQQNIPLHGVHWANEVAGNAGTGQGGALWTSVHGMLMLPLPNPGPFLRDEAPELSLDSTPAMATPSDSEDVQTVDDIRRALRVGCELVDSCLERYDAFWSSTANGPVSTIR